MLVGDPLDFIVCFVQQVGKFIYGQVCCTVSYIVIKQEVFVIQL